MKFSIIGIVGVPANYGGFESLVENLLPSDFIELVYCSSKAYKKREKTYKNARLKYLPLNANGMSSIIYDALCILHTLLFTKHHLLILGVSGAWVLPFVRLFSRRRIVTNIDGLEWKRDKWSPVAKFILKGLEGLAVKFSHSIIADNQGISEHVSDAYGISSSVIAYGGDHALTTPLGGEAIEKGNYVLALCRIEPENNVHLILEAFSKLRDVPLIFIGNWDNSEYGKELIRKYKNFCNITMENPIYDLQELYLYRSRAIAYVHGHSAGGTNPSLVEMMFFDLRIVCFDCSYNRHTTNQKAIYFDSEEALIELFDNSNQIGTYENLSELAHTEYTWKKVKSQYESLLANASKM